MKPTTASCLNRLMHLVNLCGWMVAFAAASVSYNQTNVLAKVLVHHLQHMGITI